MLTAISLVLARYKYAFDTVVIALLVAGVALGVHAYNDHQQDIGAARVQAQWDAEKQQVAEASAHIAADALATTKALQDAANKQRENSNAQIVALNTHLQSALAGLRDRPSRDSAGGVPKDSATGAALGSTGADLLRDDAAVLVREAGRADRLRLQLIDCQAAYSRAREALN